MDFSLETYLKELEHIINIDSGSHYISGNNLMADFFEQKFLSAGFLVERFQLGEKKRPLLIAKTPNMQGDDCDFFLSGHMDTVFPEGTTKERPFTLDGNIAYGPGTVDMKAGDLLIYYLACHISKHHPDIKLTICLNSDEEIGSPDSLEILRKEAVKARYAFVFEGQRINGQFVNERKGIIKYNIDVTGIPSHSGTAPHKGASAIVELANVITSLDNLKDYSKATSINVGLINGGTALNMVAPKAYGQVEIRYISEKELLRVQKGIEKLMSKPKTEGTKVNFTMLTHYPPLRITEKTQKMMDILKPFNLGYIFAGGTSDANRLVGYDIPILDGCGPGGGKPHSDHEYLDINTVEPRLRLMIDILLALYE